MNAMKHRARLGRISFLMLAALASCGSSTANPPAKSAEQCAKMGAKTGIAGAKTGVPDEYLKDFFRRIGASQ